MHELFVDFLLPENLLLYLFSYGIGSIPTSYLIARFRHRVHIGKENVHSHTASFIFKTMSKWSGMLVFCFDLFKGLLPCAIAMSLETDLAVIAVVAFFAVFGHCFSLWLNFRGGFGGATLGGSLLIIYWPAALALFMANAFFLIVGLSAGLASILGALVGAVVLFLGLANKLVFLIVLAIAGLISARCWSSIP